MKPVVIDAGLALKWYLPEVLSDESYAWIEAGIPLLVPDVLFSQVGTALWRRVRNNELKPEMAKQIVLNLRRLPLRATSSELLMRDALEIATMTSRTFQEGLYFALAIRHDTHLVTADRRWFGLVATGPMKPYIKFVTEHPGK